MKLKFQLKRFRRALKAVVRPAYFLVILVLSCIAFSSLCSMITQTKNHVAVESYQLLNKTLSKIETTAGLLYPLNSSASNLARGLSSSLNGTHLSFAAIQMKVAPVLFLALDTIPNLNQVSYIGLDGLLLSLYHDHNRMFVVYANTSNSSTWYTQPINRDTGKLYGDAVASDALPTRNASWFQNALYHTSGHSSIGTGWNKAQDILFLNTVAMDGRGVISLGFPLKVVVDYFAALDFYGGYFHLGTTEGQVIMQAKVPGIRIDIVNSTVMLKTLKPNSIPDTKYILSCDSEDGQLISFVGIMGGIKYKFYCSTLNIAGIKSVYVVAYRRNALVGFVQRNSRSSITLLVLIFMFIIISIAIYIFLTARATNREMFLCAALVQQMEATQQAERKSMNKTKAYAGASHDVRHHLSTIGALIHFCQEEANPDSKLAEQLVNMETQTKDLLGILNSILDTSKIEAGKTTLEEEEFSLAKLLEDIVDMYYPMAVEKGIDIVLDPCDGSILKSPLVKGDRIKLKQILCNLLGNAIKFTSEGHVSIRAVVKKNNFKKDIIASNRTTVLKILSHQFCYKNKRSFSDLDALSSVQENPNEMEFEFEVDDTGKGIPKDKQNSIFEDYVQVKETTMEQEGCGLGLGIVQSLVRVMKGELTIVEKEPGERGTCFKFNVFLSTREPQPAGPDEDRRSSSFHQHFAFMSPKPEGSHVIMFIPGEERIRVLKKYLESLNIKVTVIKKARNFSPELEKIKRKLDMSNSASANSDKGLKEGSSSLQEESEYTTPHFRKTNSKSISGFVLLLIDAAEATKCSNIHSTLVSFRKDIPKSLCKVVWLDDQIAHRSRDEAKDRLTAEGDFIIYKPLHGSRLTQVLSLLPERKSSSRNNNSKFGMRSVQDVQLSADYNLSNDFHCLEIQPSTGPSRQNSLQQTAVQRNDEKGSEKPSLEGKKVLIVEDTELLRRLATFHLSKLGASVEVCANGKEASDKVSKALGDLRKEGDSKCLPYDYIFMDCVVIPCQPSSHHICSTTLCIFPSGNCLQILVLLKSITKKYIAVLQMPVMNGYDATRLIREEEKHYGVHIPIIALTAHALPEESSKIMDAGMDFHLTKPLQEEKLFEVIRSIERSSEKDS
ncbi:hypothetical protein Tsubulata_023974 [Turnera subulata]|uniref:histidine kinase n=1 Tax=Turnera subulata TaxID=218843 RepID=A0A9Q0GHY4_9ROSI|nr:hypothetical protein Tsubulata_023974 [Turnera subulata]